MLSEEDINKLIEHHATGGEPFRVIVADPPWQFVDNLPGPKRGARKHYNVLSATELAKCFPETVIAKDAALFLWRVASMQAEALQLIKDWHFRHKTELTWVKLEQWEGTRFNAGKREVMGRLANGMGHYTRGAHEVCLLATRGRFVVPTRARPPSVFFDYRAEHSEKPQAFYDLVEKMSPGPYLELFSRRERPGWVCLGNEVDKFTSPFKEL